jgi:hypothetical protein
MVVVPAALIGFVPETDYTAAHLAIHYIYQRQIVVELIQIDLPKIEYNSFLNVQGKMGQN